MHGGDKELLSPILYIEVFPTMLEECCVALRVTYRNNIGYRAVCGWRTSSPFPSVSLSRLGWMHLSHAATRKTRPAHVERAALSIVQHLTKSISYNQAVCMSLDSIPSPYSPLIRIELRQLCSLSVPFPYLSFRQHHKCAQPIWPSAL